jgi:hypothetical protein
MFQKLLLVLVIQFGLAASALAEPYKPTGEALLHALAMTRGFGSLVSSVTTTSRCRGQFTPSASGAPGKTVTRQHVTNSLRN